MYSVWADEQDVQYVIEIKTGLIAIFFHVSVRTRNGNGGGALCRFPFKYQGRQVSGCISGGISQNPWCGTTDNFDADGKYGECILDSITNTTSMSSLSTPIFFISFFKIGVNSVSVSYMIP